MSKNFIYPANFEKKDNTTFITFRDVPEVCWFAYDDEDLNAQATEALQTSLDYYFKQGKEIPTASKKKKGEVNIHLPLSYVSKIILHNTMLKNRIRPADLARLLDEPTSEVARVTNPKVKTKIDKMALAVQAAGGDMQLVCI